MIHLQGERIGCEQCIRGHRAVDCQHLDKILVTVKSRGKYREKCNIRLKIVGKPKVISITQEKTEKKNGRANGGDTKTCLHLDPQTPCCFYLVSSEKGFSYVGPLKEDDDNYKDYKVNIEQSQNINLVPPVEDEISEKVIKPRRDVLKYVKQPSYEDLSFDTEMDTEDQLISPNTQDEPEKSSSISRSTNVKEYTTEEWDQMFKVPEFSIRESSSDFYFPQTMNINIDSAVDDKMEQDISDYPFKSKREEITRKTVNDNAEVRCCCWGMIICPNHLLRMKRDNIYDDSIIHLDSYRIPPIEEAIRYYETINYGKPRTPIKSQTIPINEENGRNGVLQIES